MIAFFTYIEYFLRPFLTLIYSPSSSQYLLDPLPSMSRPQHHPQALFSLKPINDRARNVIRHPGNSHLRSSLSDGELVLDVGLTSNIRSQSRNTLATLGRNDTDIIVEESSIGRVQCSFEINLDSRVIMLYDRSNSQTTQVFGDDSTPFEYGRLRRIVVQKGLNTIIGMV